MPSTILPKALQKGDTIAFISPSARLNDLLPRSLARGKTFLESLGFTIKIIYTSLPPTTTITESIRTRCEELHTAFRDPSIRAIICTIGGAHANEMLPFLDYDLIRSNPKIFLGYSDTTFLHYAIESHYPNPIQFTIDHFLHVLTPTTNTPIGPLPRSTICTTDHSAFLYGNDESTTPRELTSSPSWRWLRPGNSTGRLYGGTVSCVVRLQGTPYAPASWADKIMFLESAMGNNLAQPYSVGEFRSSLVDLALSGVLQQIQGLVVGRGYKYDDEMQDQLADVITEVFDTIVGREKHVEIPILMNVDFGHTSPLLTLPVGARVRLDSGRDEFVVEERGVEV
ncbi:LD-carboxypeptidase [Aspergillus sclerotioniger CBS 115572]|uniref:LD-carboxypeptidase n=1 Tax=Aspergillus sclerotioniger CBS 115572 TaxID=1450535 RepID=A0A317X4W5_9EURO|nr:LD-carboxypeptidase [Aspergillus sclerotioniger CBS 115572]PWY91600.1 LD-carboxypeptidase [Aspergillus sclerotioniger CBS 115572]